MKKLAIVLLTLSVGVQVALSQGTVNFNNSVSFGDTIDRRVYLDTVGGTRLVGVNWAAAVYYGSSESSITKVATAGDGSVAQSRGLFRAVDPTTTFAGTWSGGNRTIADANAGDTVWLQIRVWDITKFADYGLALAAGDRVGQSAAFQYTLSSASPIPPSDLLMKNMRAFALVPEPSTIALGVLGLGSLLLFRRKKA